jgi:hypothetical protein
MVRARAWADTPEANPKTSVMTGGADGHLGREAEAEDEQRGEECGAADTGSIGDCGDHDRDRKQVPVGEIDHARTLATGHPNDAVTPGAVQKGAAPGVGESGD